MLNVPQFIHLRTERHFGWFQVLAVADTTAVDLCMQPFVWTEVFDSIGQIPKSQILHLPS